MPSTPSALGRPALAISAFLLLGATPGADAAACLYRGTDDTARVVGSGVVMTPFPQAKSAADCSRLRVASGAVDVFVLSDDRAAIVSRRVNAGVGVLVPASQAQETAPPADSPSLLRQILLVLQGDQKRSTGSSRGAEDDFPAASLPSDKLAQPRADLVIALGPVPDANFGSFDLIVDGRPVLHVKGPVQVLTLPAAPLKAGTRATWQLEYAGKHQQGDFQVSAPERLAELKAELSKGYDAGADPKVAQLRIASGLVAAGYAWDAREMIRSVIAP